MGTERRRCIILKASTNFPINFVGLIGKSKKIVRCATHVAQSSVANVGIADKHDEVPESDIQRVTVVRQFGKSSHSARRK
jgi:hypothetical protein